ncbi:hypothetical protein cand_035460 [Cryptosporidium andersoni]|uniref:Transcription elongation factor 1 homolog n=1 Tax=Cryptosporidium andersoni TaxID=117008 RepID=A0A1J4MVL8_9CRYT|nr:hypothetical protein cand_035460 [Cryptosporidium andersoni]
MGKRKAKKVEIKKKPIPKLDREFNCPFCNNSKTVGVKMDHKGGLGHLSCRVCNVEYTTRINRLDEAVDVFSQWIDKCYEVNSRVPPDEHLNEYVSIASENYKKAKTDDSVERHHLINYTEDEYEHGDDEFIENKHILETQRRDSTKTRYIGNDLGVIDKNQRDNEIISEGITSSYPQLMLSQSFTMDEEDDGLFSD